MLRISSFAAALLILLACSVAPAQEYSVEVIDSAPETDDISAEFLKLFADKGIRIKRGGTRTAGEIWWTKQWEIDPEFEVSEERLYPFEPGQLIGLLHFSRRGKDFRDQSVSSGWYTLRFGLQPIDGNHEGTSPTRDFLLLVAAESDEPEKFWGTDELNESSSEAAGTTHPAMFCMRRATEGGELTIRHDDQTDWWTLHAVGKGVAGDKAVDVPVDLVVIGHAEE